MKNSKILIVEDEVLIAEFIFELLTEESFTTLKIANSKEEAIQCMNEFEPDIILMDINLNGSNSGIELARKKNANAAIIFLTGQYDNDLMTKALGTNPESYLTKPIKQNDLFAHAEILFIFIKYSGLQKTKMKRIIYIKKGSIICEKL